MLILQMLELLWTLFAIAYEAESDGVSALHRIFVLPLKVGNFNQNLHYTQPQVYAFLGWYMRYNLLSLTIERACFAMRCPTAFFAFLYL